MKTLHLVCNSHLDPVWQWNWDEGASNALATFYSAVNLAEKYDYIFCHNEVLLYEYMEKYDSELFERVKKLVKDGKWFIMGGWYIQPDCAVPSGESFIRQITLGREYFGEKFGKKSTCAVNFDAFAHTRGLVQILHKCGYESYLFCRPLDWQDPLIHGPFLWKGYDGSTVKALRYEDETIYCSDLGYARVCIERKMGHYADIDGDTIALWGVGNHGGLSSAKDLEDILELTNEKKGEIRIIHSTPEAYFAAVQPTKIYDKQLIAFPKSYGSCNAIKLAHDQLENALYSTERVCSVASMAGLCEYPSVVLHNAERALAQIEFHDVLSGTAVKSGTDSSIRKAEMAMEELSQAFYSAFAAMAKQYVSVKPGEDSFMLLNYQPYAYETVVETELYTPYAGALGDERFSYTLYDEDGTEIPYQIIKEESYIGIDRRKRLIYRVKLPASGLKHIGVHVERKPYKEPVFDTEGDIFVNNKRHSVRINRKTGLIDSFIIDGKEYLNGSIFKPTCFDDNEDPWGWNSHLIEPNLQEMLLDNSGTGVFEGITGCHIVSDGEILTEVESVFTKGESHVILDYKIYKDLPYVDVTAHVMWQEHKKGLKFGFDIPTENGYFAQMAYGIERYDENEKELPANRYVGAENGEKVFAIYNKSGIHTCYRKNGTFYLTALNGSVYCAHPSGPAGVKIIPDESRFVPYIEQGIHDFSFRISVNDFEECERLSQEFQYIPYSNEVFPHGDGSHIVKDPIVLTNPNVVLTACKKRKEGGYILRLFNHSNKNVSTTLKVYGTELKMQLTPSAFETVIYDGKELNVSAASDIY